MELEMIVEDNKKLTPWQVLRYKFPESEYSLISEVCEEVGGGGRIDYLLINLWRSRGLAITGIEQKSNRGDWLKELKNPKKQESHYKYCDYFYLLTNKENVAKIEEIPDSWGWYHITPNGTLKTMKPAPKLISKPVERSFLCAMIRRAADKTKFVHVDSIQDQIKVEAEKMQERNNRALENKAKNYDELKEKVDAFENASGININYSWKGNAQKIGEAVKVILNGGLETYMDRLVNIQDQAKKVYESVSANVSTIKQFQAEQIIS